MAHPRRRVALALALAAAGSGCAARAADDAGAVLVVENAERARTLSIPLGADRAFAVTYHHSMYDAPVREEFRAREDGRIALRAVSSPSAAVREYFGLTRAGERHAVERVLPEIVFRVAVGAPQRLRAGAVERSFLALGEPGDRVVMRVAPGGPPARARRAPSPQPSPPGRGRGSGP